jgi:NAD(P)-dependent dehydrogenase (short-subunit alcohol dehydrogenase family)
VERFAGKIAVITGGGSGMGRELAVQLVKAGCHVSICDLSEDTMAETVRLAEAVAPASDVRVSSHTCDVSDLAAMELFRDEVLAVHDTEAVNLLFNNAGIGGAGSMVTDDPRAWERCFDVTWGGVYNGVRAFLPAVIASDEGWIVNTSSVNGMWASVGRDRPHTAYSAAKFAVRGFTEALITDMRVNAPHVGVSVVMPGHVGTEIVANSLRHGVRAVDDDERAMIDTASELFQQHAPVTAAEAAAVILDGVRAGRWRILVGDDAHRLDRALRADPEAAYDPDFDSGLFAQLEAARQRDDDPVEHSAATGVTGPPTG